jgi:hypothetical protein
MGKKIATIKALIRGDVSIEYTDKIEMKKTPGKTTMDAAHQ